MSDREDLLNNLKIDRSAPPLSAGQQSNKLYLFGISILIVGFFGGYFYQMMNLKKSLLSQ